MLALILAGGTGSRLNMGEKPLVQVCGKPMIEYAIEAFSAGGHRIVVVGSPNTPFTRNWCRVHGIDLYPATGRGYVEDIVEAVTEIGGEGPVFTSVSDLPCITAGIVERVTDIYLKVDTPALSTWVPASLCRGSALRRSYRESIRGISACPAGLNILQGDLIEEEQEEFRLLLEEPALALNVNTRDDLALAARTLCPGEQGPAEGSTPRHGFLS
ncbi:MAG: adenosylcobinamide-phosphate guanylyltransferase [Methanofollis sp.]|nr:adenosylcobinamide-phosphate guanylyltransferase [Methanofollis sp.]